MIKQSDVMQLLVEACPSFAGEARQHVEEHGNDLLYLAAGAFAHHLLALHQANNASALASVAAAIERLHVEGSSWVKEFATIGLLEGVQNVWSNNDADPARFKPFLGPESLRWWNGLNNFWSGQASHVKPGA